MRTNFEIALRFLLSRKRAIFMTVAGITFGVGFFIVTQAQTSGFERYFVETILNTNGAIRIADRFQNTLADSIVADSRGRRSFRIRNRQGRQYIEGVEYPQRLRQALEGFPQVTGISEIVEENIEISSGFREQGAQVLGIRLEDHLRVSDLQGQLVLGDLADFDASLNSVMLGAQLAERIDAVPGDYVSLVNPHGQRRMRVAAILETGVREIDKTRVYMHLNEARSFARRPHGGAILQVAVADPAAAPQVARQMELTLDHHVVSWQEREKVWLDVFKALRLSAALTVATIIVLAGLGMYNTLALMVMEKTREIAILRSMGYTRRDVSQVFLMQGAMVYGAGLLLGWVFAALATWGISSIPLRIRGIFATDTFVVNWDVSHYLWAAWIAAVVVFLASYIPSRRAARVEPGSIIRGSAS